MHFFGERLREYSAGRILDFGTGGGGSAKALSEQVRDFSEITGVDTLDPDQAIDPKQLEQLPFTYIQHTGLPLPFESDAFDTVYICYVLHHLPPDSRITVLEELKRVLKPRGSFLLAECYRGGQNGARQTEMYAHMLRSAMDRDNGRHHYPPLRREALVTLLTDLKFSQYDIFDYAPQREDYLDRKNLDTIAGFFDKELEKHAHLARYEQYCRIEALLKKRMYRTGYLGSMALAAVCRK